MEFDFVKWFGFAFEGAPFKTYAALNALAFAAYRYSGVRTKYAWIWVAALGGISGAWGSYNEALYQAGMVPTVLYNAAFTGAILGAAGATVVGIPLALGLGAIWPQSPQKQYAEALADPKNPTLPPGSHIVDPPPK